jgi:hypothetical protein
MYLETAMELIIKSPLVLTAFLTTSRAEQKRVDLRDGMARVRVTRWVCEKIAQNLSQTFFAKINT